MLVRSDGYSICRTAHCTRPPRLNRRRDKFVVVYIKYAHNGLRRARARSVTIKFQTHKIIKRLESKSRFGELRQIRIFNTSNK